MMHKYNDSPALLLSTVYPAYDWLPWKFDKPPKSTFKDSKNIRKFLDWAGKQLGIKDPQEFRNVATTVYKIVNPIIK
jgi:hypothetical protein